MLGVLSGLKVWGPCGAAWYVHPFLSFWSKQVCLEHLAYFNCLLPELGLDGASLNVCIVPPYQLYTFSRWGSPVCMHCCTLLVLHPLHAGELCMHTAQWMHTTAPCRIHWISLRWRGPMCVPCQPTVPVGSSFLVGCLGTRYSSLAGWPEKLDRAYTHYPRAGEM